MCYEFGIVNKSLYFLDKPSCSKTLALVLQIATARVIINLLELFSFIGILKLQKKIIF